MNGRPSYKLQGVRFSGKRLSTCLTPLLRGILPGSGSERATPKHGYGGTRFYDRSAAGASGPVHEGGAVLAEASRGEPPRESNRSRAELDSKVNVYLERCRHWNVTIILLCSPLEC